MCVSISEVRLISETILLKYKKACLAFMNFQKAEAGIVESTEGMDREGRLCKQ